MNRIKRAERPVSTGTEKRIEVAPQRSHREKFDCWKVRFKDKNYRLPRRPWGHPAIDFARISVETGIPKHSLTKPPYLLELQCQAEKGLRLFGTELTLPLTISELIYLGKRAFQRREAARKGRSTKQAQAAVSNFATSCRRLEAFAGDPTKSARDAVTAAITDELSRDKPDSKTLAAWRFLDQFIADFIVNESLPAGFSDALDFIVHRTEWSMTRVAEMIGVNPPIVFSWIFKDIQPREHHEKGIEALEANLGLASKTLVGRIQRVRRYRRSKTNSCINPDGPLPQGVLQPFLPPGFDAMTKADQDAAAEQANGFYRRGINPEEAARIRMRATRYILKETSPALAAEMQAYLAFYSKPELPFGVSRDVEGLWKDGSVEMVRSTVLRFCGFLASGQSADFCIPQEQLTMALFAFPQFTHAFVNWRIARASTMQGRTTIPRTDLKPTSLGRQMLTPRTGWLWQRGDLASRLYPAASKSQGWILSPAEIAASQADWISACGAAHETLSGQYVSFATATDTSRNDHAKCLPILKDDNPQRAFAMLIDGLRREVRNLRRHGPAWRDAVRDLAFVHVEARCAFREATLRQLTYRPDNTGHVRYDVDGRLMVDAPASLFKNGKTSQFFVNRDGSINTFRRRLDQELAPCGGDLELYLGEVRPEFAGSRHGDAFLLMRDGQSMTDLDVDAIMRRITNAHLVWNESTRSGFEGIHRPLPLRFFRHVLAAGTWKKSGDVQVAADAIADSVEVTRAHYGRYVPEDRRRVIEEFISKGLAAD